MPLPRQRPLAGLFLGTLLALACSDATSPRAPVVASVAVSGLPDTVGVGDELRLAAMARDPGGDALPGVAARWRSLSPTIATIDSTGLLRGRSAGEAFLVVTTRGRTLREDTVVALVRRLPRRFVFTDVPDSVFVGARDTITVEVQDGVGRPLGPVVTWSSSDTSVLLVDSLGIVRPVNRGAAWIRASAGDRADSVRVRAEYRELMPGRFYVDVSVGSISHPPCAVTTGGQLWCASVTSDGTPAVAFQVRGSAVMRTVEGGQSQSCGLAADSTLYCWGQNSSRVFGTVSTTGVSPHDTLYPGGQRMKWRQFTLGDHQQACGIAAADSVVYCWGHNDTQQVGREPRSTMDSLVAPFATPLQAKQVDLSGFHGCAAALDDAVWCWGMSSAYGVSSSTGPYGIPTLVRPPGSFAQVATGNNFTCARTRLGEVSCWGSITGRSGANGAVPHTAPVPVAGGGRYVEIFTGFSSRACGITGERALHCWSVQEAVTTPRVIMPGRQFVTVAIGGFRTCALSTEGKMYCW